MSTKGTSNKGKSIQNSTLIRGELFFLNFFAFILVLYVGITFAQVPEFIDIGAIYYKNASGEFPRIATDGQGKWITVWYSNQGSGDQDIWLSDSTNNGTTWSEPKPLNTNAGTDSGFDWMPTIATDKNGNWVVVCSSNENLGSQNIGTDYDILVAHSTDNGESWSAPINLNSYAVVDGAATDTWPDIAYADGTWLAVWRSSYDLNGIGTDADILWATSEDNGITWSEAQAMPNSSNDTDIDIAPRITYRPYYTTIDLLGKIQRFLPVWLVTWGSTTEGDGSNDYDILLSKGTIGSSTIIWSDPVPLNSNAALDTWDDELHSLACHDNYCIAVWDSIAGVIGIEGDILIARSDDGGSSWSVPARIHSYMSSDNDPDEQPQILTDHNGQWVTVWKSAKKIRDCEDPSSDLGWDSDIFMSISSDNGATWSNCFDTVNNATVSIDDGKSDNTPQIATDGKGNWIAVWNHDANIHVATTNALKIGEEIPLPAEWTAIDWDKTTFDPATHVIKIDHAQKLLVGDWGNVITINWNLKDGSSFSRKYATSSEPVKDRMIIYSTHEGSSRIAETPAIDLKDMTSKIEIHYNQRIKNLWNWALRIDLGTGELHARYSAIPSGLDPALVVLEYNRTSSPTSPDDFIGIEIVQVKPNEEDVDDSKVHVGSRLHPKNEITGAVAYVVKGGSGDSPECIYQHKSDSGTFAQEGQVWAKQPNEVPYNMQIIWKRTGLANIEWPYEWRRYTAEWPKDAPEKYQLYVRGTEEPRGPSVNIPIDLNATLIHEDFKLGHAYLDAGTGFRADGFGWTLLKYATGPTPGQDWVGFEVVRCVLHKDTTIFNLTPVNKDIGSEIKDAYHRGPNPAYIHEPEGDRYAPGIYSETGQIFAVNTGILEVWWSNLSRTQDPEGADYPAWPSAHRVQWPSKVVRYNAVWPPAPGELVISASPIGVVSPSGGTIYYQNDSALPGFNPNDEHALEQGGKIYALRNDLGSDETSDPYVLVKSKEGDVWKFDVYKVILGQFKSTGTAGNVINAPVPIGAMDPQYCIENKPTSFDHIFEDHTGRHWVKSAGKDGTDASVTMRYHYPVQEGFFFPDDSYQVKDHAPWLDKGTGTPVNVVYTVSWGNDVPQMKINQTLIESMAGLPDIDSNASVAIVYQQSVANGDGLSVMLIDPVRIREVDLEDLPDDIVIEQRGAEIYFPNLSLALRRRIFYDPLNRKLKFKGDTEESVLLNVMSQREKEELIDSEIMSTDAAWVAAVDALYEKCKAPHEVLNSSIDKDMLALTSGYAEGIGFVTLAMNDHEESGNVSLEIIQVIAELYPGAIAVFEPSCPFDETLTLRHTGDFGGRTDVIDFEWRYQADTGGEPILPVDANWLTGSSDAVDITIKGPGLLTLSDNWFVCRYKYPAGDLPWSGKWSEWTDPQLAEGWIKRVIGAINPFEQRFSSYGDKQVNTIVSMISQAGERWVGNVGMTCENLDASGLIEIYETVLNRGKMLSIDGTPPVLEYDPANNALLLVASRIADLYMLLGNEAYADAADPTIAFGTTDGQYGARASSIHCFMNTTSSLLEEELSLLRGRDDSVLPSVLNHPVYNRLMWNFTKEKGEVAYAMNYDIRDDVTGEPDGVINEEDAKKQYPQGHGDAWGHYLTSLKTYYHLLRHSNYKWTSRAEAILVGGESVTVDYLDERKFAVAAAAKAQTGAEIVNMTYRAEYVEDPDGQWQGYKDTDADRAWGLSEWSSRAGQGAYIDWVVANAILPATDTNPEHEGKIEKIDRTTVLDLREIPSRYQDIQAQQDMADVGLNPLGIASNAVPFDISPGEIEKGKTHFEQIYERAVSALNNAITVFNHANNSTQLLRRQADEVTDFQEAAEDRETDFKNRLIEIFGYPYPDDIGPGKTYPTGYVGPDIYHYTYIDPSELTGESTGPVETLTLTLKDFTVEANGSLTATEKDVTFHISSSGDRFGCVKPPEWTSQRRAPGEIQMARSDLLQARARFERAMNDYDNLLLRIEDQAELLKAQFNLNAEEIDILNAQSKEQERLNNMIMQSRSRQLNFRTIGRMATLTANALAEFLPKCIGFATDATAPGRGAIRLAGTVIAEGMNQSADAESLAELGHQQAMQAMQTQDNILLTTIRTEFAVLQQIKQLEQTIREELSIRYELYTLQESVQQAAGRYLSALSRGQRLREERDSFRLRTAADVQNFRYKDMAFRIFRNDALQKYRAQFDLAARYVYLAAKAYDYETTILSGDAMAGDEFLTNIVRQRLIGTIQDGTPLTGQGLADPMKVMWDNFQTTLKGQLGFNNPEKQTDRFSLRSECFRIQPGPAGNALWRENLRRHVVSNLPDIPEFSRYAIPMETPVPGKTYPGIVIPFETTVNYGLNFFGWPLGGGDNYYSSAHFTTKIHSVGVWFSNYNNLSLVNTPMVYLFPIGIDYQRSPTNGTPIAFNVLDQILPAPFSSVESKYLTDPDWIPIVDNLQDIFTAVKRYADFRAYHDSGAFSTSEVIRNSRLIGRSVWNSRWLLIIPGGRLLNDSNEGINQFIDGQLIGGERDGNGVSDIKIFFETYSFSGQ